MRGVVRLPTVDVRRSGDRFVTVADGLRTAHSFTGGRHYDPTNTSLGGLVLHDEHLLAPGAGFAPHRHRGVEVVTWVLDGVLRHDDGTDGATVLRPGQVQRMAAGSGVVHVERNDSDEAPLRFVQAWLLADEAAPAAYEVQDVTAQLQGGALVVVASRADDAPLRLSVDASLHVARPSAGQRLVLPAAPRAHLFVTAGAVDVEGVRTLAAGDAARFEPGPDRQLAALAASEVLVWKLP
jgi:redox-sensitive bicupin YhaK (pirin superfamily)